MDTRLFPGVIQNLWLWFRDSWTWTFSFLDTRTNLKLMNMKTSFILILDLLLALTIHLIRKYLETLWWFCYEYINQVVCLNFQSSNSILRVDGHSKFNSCNICLSACWRRGQSWTDWIQKKLNIKQRSMFWGTDFPKGANIVINDALCS